MLLLVVLGNQELGLTAQFLPVTVAMSCLGVYAAHHQWVMVRSEALVVVF